MVAEADEASAAAAVVAAVRPAAGKSNIKPNQLHHFSVVQFFMLTLQLADNTATMLKLLPRHNARAGVYLILYY